jgi:alkaline phosphatase
MPDPDDSTPNDDQKHADAINRRSFLGALGLGVAVGYGATGPRLESVSHTAVTPPQASRRTQTAKNIIFLVSDGMSAGTMQLADLHLQQTQGHHSNWISLIRENQEIRRSVVDTTSFNSLVTDSAAAATAWGLGQLVDNGRIGETPDGKALSPILLRAREAGKATGLVTTTRITHATPAGLACNIFGGNRNDEDRIARQMIDRGYDLLLGGGGRFVNEELLSAARLRTVRTRTLLRQRIANDLKLAFADRARLCGLFADSHMAYELDRSSTEPSLAEMTGSALDWLADAPGGFLVQIEGGRVDHAAHNNDAGSLIADQIAFDAAIRVALKFAAERDDTLVVITTDHGNANPGLTDYTRLGIEGFARLEGVRHSFDWILERLGSVAPDDLDQTHAVIQSATSISLSKRDLDIIGRWRAGEAVDPFLLANRNAGPLGSVLANYTKVAFLSPNHTADYVELTALGPGSERFKPVLRISDIHDAMCKALDIPMSTDL